jgi:hypothetical protein
MNWANAASLSMRSTIAVRLIGAPELGHGKLAELRELVFRDVFPFELDVFLEAIGWDSLRYWRKSAQE